MDTTMDRADGHLLWRKSQRCEGGGCVEVAAIKGGIAMRNSTDPDGRVLRFTIVEWRDFVDGVWAGDFIDLA